MQYVEYNNNCNAISDIASGTSSYLQSFYEKPNISKHIYNLLFKSFWLIIFEVTEGFLQYRVYYSLFYLKVYGRKFFLHFL